MAKRIYDEKVYLSGDEKAMNAILKLKKDYQSLRNIEKAKYSDLIQEYNHFLIFVRDCLKSLNLASSLEYSMAIAYLISRGYLTYDKIFKNRQVTKEVHTRNGISIVSGYGICRNFCDILKDLLTLLECEGKKLYCYQPAGHLPRNAGSKLANHAINLVGYDGVQYGIDIFNNCELFSFKNPLTLKTISSVMPYQVRNKPYCEIIFGENSFSGVKKDLEEYELESKKKTMSLQTYNSVFSDTISYMKKNKDMFEDLHSETKELKEDIALRLSKIN